MGDVRTLAEINEIAVAKPYRRNGIGRYIIEYVGKKQK